MIQIKIILNYFENIISSIVLKKYNIFKESIVPGVFPFQSGCDKIRNKNKVINPLPYSKTQATRDAISMAEGERRRREGKRKGEGRERNIHYFLLCLLEPVSSVNH